MHKPSSSLEGLTQLSLDMEIAKNIYDSDKEKSIAHLLLMEYYLISYYDNIEILSLIQNITTGWYKDNFNKSILDTLDHLINIKWIDEYEKSFNRNPFPEEIERKFMELEMDYLNNIKISC